MGTDTSPAAAESAIARVALRARTVYPGPVGVRADPDGGAEPTPGSPGMTTWTEFSVAPRIAEIFVRRHVATGNLCMLATNRPDGFPRIGGMPNTAKFRDLLGRTGFGESLVRLWWANMSPSSIDAPLAAV